MRSHDADEQAECALDGHDVSGMHREEGAVMGAEVSTIYRHQAVCVSCGWWGPEVESEDTAGDDAQEHNEENHDD